MLRFGADAACTTMKLHIQSDLHTEFADFVPPETEAEAVILAGDIGVGVDDCARFRRIRPRYRFLPGFGAGAARTGDYRSTVRTQWIVRLEQESTIRTQQCADVLEVPSATRVVDERRRSAPAARRGRCEVVREFDSGPVVEALRVYPPPSARIVSASKQPSMPSNPKTSTA